MAVTIAVVKSTTPGSATTKEFTSSGFGTPDAAIVIVGSALSTANPGDHVGLSIGFTDGTRQSCMGIAAEHNQSSEKAYRRSWTTKIVDSWHATKKCMAEFDSFVTDGVKLDFTLDSAIHYIEVILIKGVTNVYAGSKQLTSTSVNVEDPNFKPDLVLLTCVGWNTDNDTASAALLSFGASHNSSSDVVTNWQTSVGVKHGDSNGYAYGQIRNESCVGQYYGTSVTWRAALDTYDSLGFTVTANASTGDDYIHYLALELSDPDDAAIGIIDTPTSTGTEAYTGVGFEPLALLLSQTHLTAVNAPKYNSSDEAGVLALGASDGTTEVSIGSASDSGPETTNHQSDSNQSGIAQLYADDGSSTTHVASLDSFDTDGFTLDFTDTDATARKWGYIAFKDTSTLPSYDMYLGAISLSKHYLGSTSISKMYLGSTRVF